MGENELYAELVDGRRSAMSAAPGNELWAAVDALIDRAPSRDHLRWHGLHLLAFRRWRTEGRPIQEGVFDEEREAGLRVISAPLLLERVRAAVDGTIVLVKGYEVGLRYKDPALRPFVDVDLLVEDSEQAQRALIAAGFEEFGEPDLFIDIHHQRPLWFPGLPLGLELHHAPKWPARMTTPPTPELLSAAVPSLSGVDGISTLPPAEHALLLAAHSWAHLPLRRIQELVDIAAVTEGEDRGEIRRLAKRWDFDSVWRTTIGSVDSLFYGGPLTSADRVWARHLRGARERTVLESHVGKWLSAFWALPWWRAVSSMGSAVADEFKPAEGETWGQKRARTGRAFRNASLPRSEHDRQLGPDAHRWGRRR